MPRVPSYRLHRPSGQAVVTLAGKDHYLGKFGSPRSKAEYDRVLAGWLSARAAPPRPRDPAPAPLSVAQVMRAWLTGYAEVRYVKRGRHTEEIYRARTVVRLAAEGFGALPAADFRAEHLLELRARLVRAGRSRPHVNSVVGVLRGAFRWAASPEAGRLVPAAVVHDLWIVRGLRRADVVGGRVVREGRRVRAAEPAHVAAALARACPKVRAMAAVQRLAGMRPCEVYGMRPRDLDRGGRLGDGTRFAGVWVYEVADDWNKTAHKGLARVVFLGPRAQKVLAPWLAGKAPEARVFETEGQGRLWLWRHVRNACRAAGVAHWAPNQLRHLRATEVRSRYGADAARTVLGHRLPGVTGRYAEEDLEKAAKVMREIG